VSYTPGFDGPPIDLVPAIPDDWSGRCATCGETRGCIDRFYGTASDGWEGRVYTSMCGHEHWRWMP
jgi:hypothetical protein